MLAGLGSLPFTEKEAPFDELVIGADHIWASADIDDRTIELKLDVSGAKVSGVVAYGWGNTGPLRGVRATSAP